MDTFARMRQLVGTSAEWGANNLIIGLGELALEIVSPGVVRMKIGDGASNWSALPYYDPGVGSFVLKAGDTMTGLLTAPSINIPDGGTAQVPTPTAADASRKAATTAWVRNLMLTRGQGDAVYGYNGATLGTPPTGKLNIVPGAGDLRTFQINAVDADGIGRLLTLFQPGDSLIITNEFTPTTSYARYDLVGGVTDHTTWVQFDAHLIDLLGVVEAPPVNTRVKLTGYLNLSTGDGPILGVSAGTGLTGGGSVGVVTLAVDPAVVVTQSMADAAGDLIVGTGVDTLARLPRGTAGKVLGSTASGIAWGNAGLSLYSETVLGAAAATMDVTIPAGAKYVELQWATGNTGATNGDLRLLANVAGVPNAGAIYNHFATYVQSAAPTTAGAFSTLGGVGIILAAAASQSSGALTLRNFTGGTSWYFTGSYYNFGTAHIHTSASGLFSLAGVTGFRLLNNGATPTFIAGSYLRCLAIA